MRQILSYFHQQNTAFPAEIRPTFWRQSRARWTFSDYSQKPPWDPSSAVPPVESLSDVKEVLSLPPAHTCTRPCLLPLRNRLLQLRELGPSSESYSNRLLL